MDSNVQKLCLGTYNAQHFGDLSEPYLKQVLKKCDIVFIQEHCLYVEQLPMLHKLGNILYHGSSPMDISVPLLGRPYGGCAIIWRDNLHAKFSPLPVTSTRICGGIMTLHDKISVLLINIYLPCDNRFRSPSYYETVEVLDEASSLILNNCGFQAIDTPCGYC